LESLQTALGAPGLPDADGRVHEEDGENDCGLHKGLPEVGGGWVVLEVGEESTECRHAQEDLHQAVLELLRNEMPDAGGWRLIESIGSKFCQALIALQTCESRFHGGLKGGEQFLDCL